MNKVSDQHDVSTKAAQPKKQSRFRDLIELFSLSLDRFTDVDGFRLGAAFSYYATFSIFPLLLLFVTFVGFLLGDSASARERLLDAVSVQGSPVREVLDHTLTTLQESQGNRGLSALVGFATLLFAASGAFVELNVALNRIWCVPDRRSTSVWGSIRLYVSERLSGLAIVVALGLTLLVSLVSSSILSAVADRASQQLHIAMWPALIRTAELALSMLLLATVFTAAFHFIPRTHPAVRVVVRGAILTTVLLTVLKELFASYLSQLTKYSAYGVAGGMLALTTWIYVSSMVIFFGAQLTRIYAEKIGVVQPPSDPAHACR